MDEGWKSEGPRLLQVPWSAWNHITTSFLRNAIRPYLQVCHRAGTDHIDAWMISLWLWKLGQQRYCMSVIFNSENAPETLSAALCLDLLGSSRRSYSTDSLAVSGGGNPRIYKGHEGKGGTGRGSMEKRKERKRKRDKFPYRHFFFPIPALKWTGY